MSARFVVLQKDLNPPSREALARACARVPGLTAADAGIMHKDAFGILIKDFPQASALVFHEALLQEGVETEVVEQHALPALPAGKTVPRLDAEVTGLRVHDALGRVTLVPWEELTRLGGLEGENHYFQPSSARKSFHLKRPFFKWACSADQPPSQREISDYDPTPLCFCVVQNVARMAKSISIGVSCKTGG